MLERNRSLVKQQRGPVDRDHGNAFTAWRGMGSPTTPTPAQFAALHRAAALTTIGAPQRVTVTNGAATLRLTLPRQSVSLVEVSW